MKTKMRVKDQDPTDLSLVAMCCNKMENQAATLSSMHQRDRAMAEDGSGRREERRGDVVGACCQLPTHS